MSDSPKRSRGDTIGQLIVILLLMAILVGAIWFLHDFVASHASGATVTPHTDEVYNYSCCVGATGIKHYVGGVVVIQWQRHSFHDAGTSSSSITLRAQLSHRFANTKTLTTHRHTDAGGFTLGPYILSAPPLTLSDRVRAHPVTRIQMPKGAKPGWYEIRCTSTVDGVTSESGLFFHVFPRHA